MEKAAAARAARAQHHVMYESDGDPCAVSKALNDHPRISDKTKIAVRQIAENLNYQPNHLASALRKGKSNLVGVIIPRNNSNFFSSVVENMEEVLNKEGYNIIITQSNESYKKECSNIDALLFTQVDGIIASIANNERFTIIAYTPTFTCGCNDWLSFY